MVDNKFEGNQRSLLRGFYIRAVIYPSSGGLPRREPAVNATKPD
jgi:hypothetical protein